MTFRTVGALAVLGAVALAGCAAGKSEGGSVPFTEVARGSLPGSPGAADPQATLAADADDFTALTAGASPPGGYPSPGEVLLVVSGGSQPTGGYFLEVVELQRRDSALTVEARLVAPPPDALTIQTFTDPWVAVAVPRMQLEDVTNLMVNLRR